MDETAKSTLSIVIPCYRSAAMIGSVVERIDATMEGRLGPADYEIILVDDSSPDDTLSVLMALAEDRPNIKVLGLSRNFGQHAALMAGFSEVRGECVVCMDDDGQTPPEQLFRLVDRLGPDCDLVYARYEEKHHSPFRNFGSRLNDLMARWLLGKPKDLFISSYFAAKRYLVDEVLRYRNPFPYMQGQMLRATNKIANVTIEHADRMAGDSGYSFRKLLALWLNGFTAFSVKPLRIASLMGVFFALCGFVSAIIVIVRRLLDPNMALGWSSTFTIILVIGGLILFVLGLIGEYVGRSYISLNSSPQYVVRSARHCSDHPDSEYGE